MLGQLRSRMPWRCGGQRRQNVTSSLCLRMNDTQPGAQTPKVALWGQGRLPESEAGTQRTHLT